MCTNSTQYSVNYKYTVYKGYCLSLHLGRWRRLIYHNNDIRDRYRHPGRLICIIYPSVEIYPWLFLQCTIYFHFNYHILYILCIIKLSFPYRIRMDISLIDSWHWTMQKPWRLAVTRWGFYVVPSCFWKEGGRLLFGTKKKHYKVKVILMILTILYTINSKRWNRSL